MSQLQLFPSDDESNFSPDPQPESADPRTTPSPPNISTDPKASPRGRLPTRTATRSPRRRGQPSPPPARHHNPSPASSYRSAVPTIPPIAKWTVLGLRQALINSDVQFSRRMNKAELYALYVSLQSTNLSPKSMPAPKRTSRQSKAQDSPRWTTPPSQRTKSSSFPASNRSGRPSASLGRAPVPSAVRPRQQAAALAETRPADLPSAYQNMAPAVPNNPFSFQWPPAPVPDASVRLPPLEMEAQSFQHSFATATNPSSFQWPPAPVPDASVRLPPLALEAQSFQPAFATATNPSSFQWPAAPVAQASVRLPPLAARAHSSQFQPSFPSHTFNPLPQAPEADSSVRLPPLTIAAPALVPFSSLLQAKSQHSLFTATQMPVPSNAVAAEPPPVSHNIRAQILSGADVDLSSLLSLLPVTESNRQIDCGDFSVTLKNPNPHSSRLLSFSEFTIAFSRFTEVICSAFPHRRRELNDYLSIIAELALSYGGGHFYTYHKLFSAKCSVRVAQWNQCPYWGALDPDLHSRVFLGCKNISCAVCRSVAHSTTTCPQVNPSIPPCPDSAPVKSTSYVPRPTTHENPNGGRQQTASFSNSSQLCNSFNHGRCYRQRCRFLHVCNFCGGAHARHVCPVYKAVNKKSKNYLSTPVNISRLAIELAHHPDTHFTHYLLSGLEHGFKPGVECPLSQNIVCNNLQSALAEPDIVDNLIKKEVESGFMIGPFDNPPFEVFRISPIGVATRKFSGKKRLIIDLSAPHDSPFPSINSLIPLDEFSLKYHDVDQAIDMIKTAGRGAWLAKIDITSAFKVMPIHPDSWHLFGVRWQGKFYFSVRLTFGCKSSPKIFDMLSEAVCWILSNNYAIPHLIHLLDDFLIISPPDAIPAAHFLTVQNVFSELGIPIAQEKTMGPTTSIEFLGINLDSVQFQASLPKEKIDRIILVSSTLIDRSNCSKRELLSLLGHLNFAMRIIPQGRPFILHLLSLASSVNALEDLISISQTCRDELRLWITFLKQWNGLSFFYNNLVLSPVDIQLFTDAAPSIGFGGFYQGHWFASPWPPQLQDMTQSSALFELYPLVVAAFLWGKEWATSKIQDAGSRGRPIPNSSTSLFRTNIPVTHPLKQLLDASLDTILQAVSPRTLQSYVTAWRCFKAFHFSYNLPFPDFSLIAITSFISYLNSIKGLQVGSIKGYLSGIQFFHKLMYGAPSPEINNSQTSLLVKGIQRSHPTHPDNRQPITLDILTKCIHALRTVYQPLETARTLDAMFILAFFGFLRCSELAITSKFDPRVHPTISDLAVLDSETISYLIKQSKTDQSKKGHFIYIFKLSSPIQPYQSIQAYLQWRSSQAKSPLDPLFLDDSNKPVTRFWFQKHLKLVLQQSGIQAKLQSLFPHRSSNLSSPKRPLPAADPSSRKMVLRRFPKLHQDQPVPH
ncbi:proline and serine-rich protein 1-like [Pimephales promelas]|nr:proline and serine-rich protein 1-like [Pimephales promelas]